MIIFRSPLRLTLGGGGTDLESYSSKYGAFFITAAINKHVYVSASKPFKDGIFLKYSDYEHVSRVVDIEHDLFRSGLSEFAPDTESVELYSFADIPGGTGLGSSGSFTCAAISAIREYSGLPQLDAMNTAEQAYKLESRRAEFASGRQDPYASALGGFRAFEVTTDGTVKSDKLDLPSGFMREVDKRTHLFFSGSTRESYEILKRQVSATLRDDKNLVENLHRSKEVALSSLEALQGGDLFKLSNIINTQWEEKILRDPSSVPNQVNKLREIGLENGAIGAKLIGAGGGGFVMFLSESDDFLDNMRAQGYLETPFSFANEGLQRIV